MFPHGMDFRGRHKAAIGLKSDYIWRWGLSPLPPMTDLDSTRLLVYSSTKKNFFSFFTLTPSLFAWNALFIGVSVVRVSVRVNVLPSHYSHTYPHTPTLPARKHPACWGFYGWVSDSIGRAQKSSCLSAVQLWYTVGATMLHLWCQNALLFWHYQDCWYSYAGLLV